MPSDYSLTPAQRREMRNAARIASDPETQRRLRDAQAASARHPTITRVTESMVEAIVPAMQRLDEAITMSLSRIDFSGLYEVVRIASSAFLGLFPRNARELGTSYWPAMQRLAVDEQLCLSWVPRPDLALALLSKSSSHERDELLEESLADIVACCQEAVFEVRRSLENPDFDEGPWPRQLGEAVDLMLACLTAMSEGHHEAAQALATCVSDSLLTQHIARPAKSGIRPKAHAFVKQHLKQVDEQRLAAALLGPTLAAVNSSFRQASEWGPEASAPVRSTYGRHATVHAMSAEAFTVVTAIKSILIATSLLETSVSPWLLLLVRAKEVEPGPA